MRSNLLHALKMVGKFGRTTNLRDAYRLEEMGLIVITYTDRLPGNWNKRGSEAAFGYVTEKGIHELSNTGKTT